MTGWPARIALVFFGLPGSETLEGLGKNLFHLARALAENGAEVTLYCISHTQPDAIDGVRVRVFRPSRNPFKMPAGLKESVLDWSPDFLHLHSCYLPVNVSLARFARRAGIPYAVSPQGAISPGSLRFRWWLKLPYKYLLERPLLNKAAFVHSVGAHEALPAYGVRSPIETIVNGVETVTEAPPSNPTQRTPGRRRFLFVGRLDIHVKGLDLLVEGAGHARSQDFTLVIAGPSQRGGRRKLQRAVARLGLSDRVRLQGPCLGSHKRALLAEADVFVHTSRHEGMPLAVLEACSLGLPCLVTRPASLGGRLSGAGGAVLVKNDPLSIASGMIEFCGKTSEQLKEMGSEGQRLMQEEFQWSQVVSQMMEAYRRWGNRRPAGDSGR